MLLDQMVVILQNYKNKSQGGLYTLPSKINPNGIYFFSYTLMYEIYKRMEKKTIAILGGGVGGLTAAHELSKNPNLEIHVYERHDSMGGQARSVGSSTFDFSEYCWHVFGSGYVHLLRILEEIPYGKKRVSDNLVGMRQFLYGRYDGEIYDEIGDSFLCSTNIFKFLEGLWKCGGKMTMKDTYLLFCAFLTARYGSKERLDKYQDVLWSDYMGGLSPEMKKWVIDAPSIYLRMDTEFLSTQLMLSMFRKRKSRVGYPTGFYSLAGPMHKLWFEPWVNYLTEQGVIFHFEEIIMHVNNSSTEIESVFLEDETRIEADVYINALSVEEWARVLQDGEYKNNFMNLSENGRQIQCHVLYHIPSRISVEEPCIIILPDTEWCIMVRVEGSVWDEKWDLRYQDLFSAGIGIWHRPGINGKTAEECTRQEIAAEVWNQIQSSKKLMKYITLENGTSLSSYSETPEWDIWDSYIDTKNGIETYEPKFSNNIGTLSLRPEIKDTTFTNLYHSVAYAKTEMNVFCMESAAEAGVKIAKLLGEKKVSDTRFETGIIERCTTYLDEKYLGMKKYLGY